jgi:formylglycine-generating enzyme required for sulfatase activity
MTDKPRQTLRKIIVQYGTSICEDHRKVEGLLRDYCPEYKREINVLVLALKERVADDLIAQTNKGPIDVVILNLTQRIHDNHAIENDFASWAVESWAIALGVISSPLSKQPVIDDIIKANKSSKKLIDKTATKISEENDPDKLYELGLMYHAGKQVTKDLTDAVKCYRKAAEQGNTRAKAMLGLLYPKGQGESHGDVDSTVITSPALGSKFVLIPVGAFMMGSSSGESDETPHQARIWKPFFMQTTEVTQGQWEKVMGSNPSYFKECGYNCPVENVSWEDVQEFIQKLNSMEGSRNKYRLPTEAEWEYAARGGGKDEDYSGGNDIEVVAWYKNNSGGKTHPVGQKKPNGLGIYDMSGNVWEWCQDWYGDYPSGHLIVIDPAGPSRGVGHVFRGGSWDYIARYCRSAFRSMGAPNFMINNLGFRLAASVQ